MLPQAQDLESLKVGQSTSSDSLRTLLGPGTLLPFLLDLSLLPSGIDDTGAGSALDGEDDWGEDDVLELDVLTLDGGAIDQNLFISASFCQPWKPLSSLCCDR